MDAWHKKQNDGSHIMAAIGVTAVFGSDSSNTVTSSTNITSAGTQICHILVQCIYELHASFPAPKHTSGQQVIECSVGDSTLPMAERSHHWLQTALQQQQWQLQCEHYRGGEQAVHVDWTDSIHQLLCANGSSQ